MNLLTSFLGKGVTLLTNISSWIGLKVISQVFSLALENSIHGSCEEIAKANCIYNHTENYKNHEVRP